MTLPLNKRKTEPDLCTLLDQVKFSVKSEINCISIGKIKKFYPSDQTADVALNYKSVDLYSGLTSDYQPLVKCPVVVLNGGGAAITFPIAVEDTCLVFFCDREIDTWFKNGEINAPQSLRVHDLNDGIALVGVRPSTNSLTSYGTDGIKISLGNGFIQIKNNGDIVVNTPGTLSAYAATLNAYGTNVTIVGSTAVNINP